MRLTSSKALCAATALCAAVACAQQKPAQSTTDTAALSRAAADSAAVHESRHLTDIKQLTHGGENAEAYFSHDGTHLIFQSTRNGRTCDQEFTMRVDGTDVKRVSNGLGKTTCGYYMDGDRRIFFASTHATDTTCPPK